MRKWALLALVPFFASVHAEVAAAGGSSVGNGGAGVLCAPRDGEGNRPSLEMLDTYEARVLRKIDFKMGPAGTALDQVKFVLDRFAQTDGERAARYGKRAQGFFDDSVFVSDAELIQIPDTGYLFLPRNCEMVQIAIQRPRQFPDDKKFVIDQSLWDLLSESERAVLILHEIVYEELIDHGAENAIGARYFNAYLSSGKFTTLRQVEYFGYLDRFRAGLTEALRVWIYPTAPGNPPEGYQLSTQFMEFYEDGSLRSALPPKDVFQTLSIAGQSVSAGEYQFSWHRNGSPEKFWIAGNVTLPMRPEVRVKGALLFDEATGALAGGQMVRPHLFQHRQKLEGTTYEVLLQKEELALLNLDGTLKGFQPLENALDPTTGNPFIKKVYQGTQSLEARAYRPGYMEDSWLEYWDNGYVRIGMIHGYLPVLGGEIGVYGRTEFFEAGSVWRTRTAMDFDFTTVSGEIRKVPAGYAVVLDEQGRLVSAEFRNHSRVMRR